MKHLLLLLGIIIGIEANAQITSRNTISIEQLQIAADNFAHQRWGKVDAADPIPYYDPQDNIIAYGFNYAIGKEFPTFSKPVYYNESDENGKSKNLRWGINEFSNLIMGNNRNRIAIVRYTEALSDDYAFSKEIKDMASQSLENPDPLLVRVYYQTPLLKYYKYEANGNSVYVRIFPPSKVLSESEFQDEYVRNFDIEKIMPKSSPKKWDSYLGNVLTLKSTNAINYIPQQDVCVPFLEWHYGCSPTAGGMLLGYWDNYSHYSSNDYGNLSKYHFEEGNDYNISSAQEKCAIEMGTTAGGSTSSGDIGPGVVAAANSSVCGSYNFSQTTTFYDFGENTAKWNQQVGEINADRPWHCGVDGHSITAIGYETTAADSFMIVHNTWNPPNDWWNYTLNYRISEIYPGGQYGASLQIISPNGDPGYDHNGNGEIINSGNVFEITWNYDYYSGSYCMLYYSLNAGDTWFNFETNTPNDGSYLWTVPSSLSSSEGRIKIKEYSSGGTLIATDGSWGNFSFVTGSSIITLTSDVAQTTTVDPTYYKLSHTSSTWGAVGIRTNNVSTNNWSMRLYDSDNFANEVEASTYYENVDFIVFDQHHLTNILRGVKTYQVSGSGDARTEFEGYTETISVGITTVHSWIANDVVEIWDIYLAPGTYKFTMNYNSGSANLDMAIFSSNGGPYYQNRGDYISHSSNSGTNDESFFVTITNYDYYGFIVWANDANSANVSILVETTTAGLWEGDVSTNWNTSGNWNDNSVPNSTTDVVIPSGTLYSPYVNWANAYAKTLTLESGATLTLGEYDLNVYDETHIYGTIAMNNSNADMLCWDDIYWESGSQANITAMGEFRIYGNWNFQSGANVQLTGGRTWFLGTSTKYIRCYEANCYFNSVYSDKSGGAYIGLSAYSYEDLTINGNLNIYAGSGFNSYSSEKIILNGGFNNLGGNFICNFGTFEFAGTNSNLQPNVGDYFNNLIINTTSDVNILNTYSDSLVINGNLTIESGILKSNNNTIVIRGDWHNQLSSYNFWEGTGTVIFNGSETLQHCYGENFYNVNHVSTSTNLHFDGNTNINNNFYVNGFCWSNETMYVDNMYLNTLFSKFTANIGSTVEIDHLDMEWTLFFTYTGTIVANGGDIIVNDLNEDGLMGSFVVYDGTLDITQDASSFIDFNGSINISGGTMLVRGGSGPSYWPYSSHASITMTSGVLDFTNIAIRIHNSTAYNLSTNITGGVIRTGNSFVVADVFYPTGGTIEFYGGLNQSLHMNYNDAALYNMHVNKSSGLLACTSLSARISNNIILDGGLFSAPNDTLYVGGDWTNNVGPAGFYELNQWVCFYGPGSSEITTNEQFEHLVVDKTYSSYLGLVQLTGLDIIIDSDLHIIDGTYEMDMSSNIDIDGDIIIENGAGFNANDSYTEVFLSGDIIDYNTTISSTTGLEIGSTNDWTFDGTTSQNINVSATDVEFGNLFIDKSTSNLIVNFYDGIRVKGDVNIISGICISTTS